MSRLRTVKHLLASSSGGGGGSPGVNNIILGFNIQGTNYYSPNLVDTNLAQTANDADTGTSSYPSGAEIPAATLNSRGQVTTLPSGQTAWVATFNSPEHAASVNVAWSPVGSVSAVVAHSNCTVNSLNLAAGTAVVTPSHIMSDLQAWALRFTPTGTAMTSLTAIPVGLSAGLTTNFLAEVSQMSQAGGTLRNMKRNSVEDNQGFFVYQQSNSRVLFPSSGILTAANRNVPGSPNTTPSTGQISGQPDFWNGRKSDGEPFETMIAHANAANRCLWFSTPWNCDSTYLQAFADAVCSTAINTVYVEVANEVWNLGYRVHSQAIAEAHNRLCFLDRVGNVLIDDTTDPQSNSLTDPTTSVVITAGNLGYGERYCEKVIQQAQILKARCVANGKANAIKIVFCWQNASATYVGQMLDYIPRGSGGTATLDGTTVKANVDCVSSAPYFQQQNTPTNVPPTSMSALADDLRNDIDSVTTVAGQIATVGAARGLPYLTYEGGDSVIYANAGAEIFFSTGDTTTPVSVQVARDPIMYDCYMYWLDRLNHRLPSGSIITKYSNCAGVSGAFGAWGSIEMSIDMELDAATLKSTRPKAGAIRDFILGYRKLQPLSGSVFAGTGAQVGDVVGSYKYRTFGSTFSLTGTAALALTIVDSTAEVIQLAVANATYFASAGTVTGTLVETMAADPAGSRTTAISCPVISTPIWSVSKSAPAFNITNSGLTGYLSSGGGVDTLLIGNQAATALDKWFDVTVDVYTGSMSVGLCPASASYTSVATITYWKGGAFVLNTNPVVTGLSTFGAGDKIRIRVKNGTDFYAAKWNGSAWVYQNGANPSTNTGAYVVSGMDSTWLPIVDFTAPGTQITADFTSWA